MHTFRNNIAACLEAVLHSAARQIFTFSKIIVGVYFTFVLVICVKVGGNSLTDSYLTETARSNLNKFRLSWVVVCSSGPVVNATV